MCSITKFLKKLRKEPTTLLIYYFFFYQITAKGCMLKK